jgi:hypothetical protein
METGSVKRPSFQFYPGDWLNDAALRMVSVPARGLWIEMICLMHQGSDYGYLKVNGKVILPANLARMSGATLEETEAWLRELEDAGVFVRDEHGCIYSKRMIRDERVRAARAAGGKLGGNPNLKKSAKKGEPKDNLPPNHPPTPSSSSSSSSSVTPPNPPPADAGGEGEPDKVKPFDQFWDAYPHKVDKIDARKVWTKLKVDADPELQATILAAVEAQKAGDQWMRDNGQYIPGPARWLRGGRWLDVVRPYTAAPPKLPPGWWESPEGIKAAGLMLDPPIIPLPGEGQKAVALRIRVALGEVDMPPRDVVPGQLAPLERRWMPPEPPTPPAGVNLTPEQEAAREEERQQQHAAFRDSLEKLKQKGTLATAGVAAANATEQAA